MAKNKNEPVLPIAQAGDLGALLVALREKVGYSIAQTADAMCLSEDTITRLENEDFDALAEPPYIRGYLRNYAKLADSDATDLITCYESLRGADPSALNYHFKTSAKIHTQSKRRLSPVMGQVFFLALLLAFLIGLSMIPAVNNWIKSTWNSFSNQTASQSSNVNDNPLLTGNMPVPTPLPEDDANTGKNKQTPQQIAAKPEDDKAADDKKSTNADNKDDKATDKKTEDTAKNGDKPNADSSIIDTDSKTPAEEARIPGPGDGTINIKLVFKKEVWMRIRDGKKKTVFEGQNASGQEKVLNLKKPLTFRVGNAQGLSLFVDGKPVNINGYIKGSVANFTLK